MKSVIKTKDKSLNGIILLLVIFCSPNLLLIVLSIAEGSWHIAFIRLYNTIICSLIFLFPAVLIAKKSQYYFYSLALPSMLIPLLILTIIIYQKLPTRWLFTIILNSTKAEVIEFIRGQWLLLTSICIFPMLTIGITKRYISATLTFKRKQIITVCSAFVILFACMLTGKLYQRKSSHLLIKTSLNSFINNTPIQTVKRLINAFKAHHSPTHNLIFNEELNINYKLSGDQNPNVVVLILGESSRYNNWGINGYDRNTSPFLHQKSNLLSFSNIISPSFSTLQSIPFITTTATPLNFKHEPYTCVTSMFQAAGYKTYWVSTQTSQGNLIGSIALQADSSIYIGHKNRHAFDTDLIPRLEKILLNTKQKTLIILHTNGSHYPYQNRYTDPYNQFTPSVTRNRHVLVSAKNQQKLINSYDNSILFTDAFIHNVIKSINKEGQPAILCYVSDHGENLFEKNRIGYGRGYGQLSKQLYHVPLFFWANEAYIQQYPKRWVNLKANINKKASSTVVPHTLSHLSGIEWEGLDSTLCLSNNTFNMRTRYFVFKNKTLDYDYFFDKIGEENK